MSLLTERRIHQHVLAPGWKMMALVNPATEGYSVGELDFAQADRFCHLIVRPDLSAWIEYEFSRGDQCDRDVIDFLTSCGQAFFKETTNEMRIQRIPGPRSWERVMEIKLNCNLPENLMSEVISGLVGAEVATQFLASLRDRENRPIPFSEIVKDYAKVQPKIIQFRHQRRHDILNTMVIEAFSYMMQATDKAKTKLHEPLLAFAMDLPDELKMVLAQKMLRERSLQPILFKCPELRVALESRLSEVMETAVR
jgi:hypothetical protein